MVHARQSAFYAVLRAKRKFAWSTASLYTAWLALQSAQLAPHYVYADITAQYRAACALRAVGQSLSPEEMMMFTTGEAEHRSGFARDSCLA